MRQRELEVLGQQLFDIWPPDIVGLLNLDDLENVDGPEAGAVAGSHVLVQGLDGFGTGHLAVLLVHVVRAGAGVVADPDTKVLDLLRVFLVDLCKSHASSARDDLIVVPCSTAGGICKPYSS